MSHYLLLIKINYDMVVTLLISPVETLRCHLEFGFIEIMAKTLYSAVQAGSVGRI